MGNVSAFKGTVSHLCGVDGAPHFVLADSSYKELGHRVEGQLAGLGDQHVAGAQQ